MSKPLPEIPPTPAVDSPTVHVPDKRWRAGTLTYTAGGLVVLFCWLLWGDFAWQLKERSAHPVVQIMLRKFEASDFLTAFFIVSLPAIVGMILGPIISYRSDRHRGRWGRRIPFLLIPTPIVMLSIYGLAFSPAIGRWLHGLMAWSPQSLNLTIIVILGLSWTVFEFATVAANAVFGALVNDVVPREVIGRFYGMFRGMSLGAGMFFYFFLVGHVREHYVPILVTIGTVYGLGFMLMCLKVKEGEYPPPPAGETPGFLAAVKSYFHDCFSKPYYLWVFALMVLAAMTFVPINLFSIYSAESFGMSMTTYGRYQTTILGTSLVLAYPLGWMADRFHAIRMGLGAMAVYVIMVGAGYFGITGPKSFGLAYLAHGILSGCYFTGAAALGQMLFPKMKFAQFASAALLITAACNSVFGLVLGAMLDRLGHDYRYTFGVSALWGLMTLLAGLIVYRRFESLGGAKNYVAPV